jgi:hypothetical protein
MHLDSTARRVVFFLRRGATHEIATRAPFEEVLATVLRLVTHEGGACQ